MLTTILLWNRLCYVASREGHLVDILSYVHIRRLTPSPALLFNVSRSINSAADFRLKFNALVWLLNRQSLIALLMIIPGDIGSLIDFFSFTAWIFYGGAMVALIVLRYTKPKAPRPYKVRWLCTSKTVTDKNTKLASLPAGMQVPIVIPIIVLLISVYLVIGPIVDEPKVEYLYATLFILAGFIFYVPFVYYKLVMPGMSKLDVSTAFIRLKPDDSIWRCWWTFQLFVTRLNCNPTGCCSNSEFILECGGSFEMRLSALTIPRRMSSDLSIWSVYHSRLDYHIPPVTVGGLPIIGLRGLKKWGRRAEACVEIAHWFIRTSYDYCIIICVYLQPFTVYHWTLDVDFWIVEVRPGQQEVTRRKNETTNPTIAVQSNLVLTSRCLLQNCSSFFGWFQNPLLPVCCLFRSESCIATTSGVHHLTTCSLPSWEHVIMSVCVCV